MKVTSTEFRKNLFQLVERALEGEYIEVVYKGRVVRLVPGEAPTKLSRLAKRETAYGSMDDLESAQKQLDVELREAWEKKWALKL